MDWKLHARNISWQLSEQVFRVLSGLFVGLWVARYLEPTAYGLFGFAMIASSAGVVIARFGMDSTLVRDLVRFSDSEHLLASTALSMRIATGTIVAILAAWFVGVSDRNSIYLAISMFSIIALSTDIVDSVFQARQSSGAISAFKIIQAAISAALRIVMIVLKVEPGAFVLLILADAVILAGVYLLLWKKAFPGKRILQFDLRIAVRLLRESSWMYLNSLAVLVYSKIDQLLVRRILSDDLAGNYYAAVRLTDMFQLVPASIINAVFPSMARAGESLREKSSALYGITIWVGLIYAVGVAIFASPITLLLFGAKYEYAADVLSIHCWIGVAVGVSWVSGKLNVVEGFQRISFINTAITGVLSFPLCWILLTNYGLKGAAYSALLSSLFSGVAIGVFWPQTRYRFRLFLLGFLRTPYRAYSFGKYQFLLWIKHGN